jgi:hypothetical protein
VIVERPRFAAETKLAYNNQKAILIEELQLPVFERDPDQPSLA